MNQQALSAFIWAIAGLLRGDYKQSEYGKVTERAEGYFAGAGAAL
ncbi:hypothetical protein [Thiobacillus sp.]|jgi:type I restriction-modification system DNA methylase subunit|nr:hypothetical protein [Thiobacillus sp.]